MSLIFTPKIPDHFNFIEDEGKVTKVTKVTNKVTNKVTKVRPAKAWTGEDINTLIELRALALPHVDCGLVLKRRAADCSSAVHKHGLQQAIRTRRKAVIAAAIERASAPI